MDSLPVELITKEISRWLLIIDRQILRRVNKNFRNIFPYKRIFFNDIRIELVHLIRYKKLLIRKRRDRYPYTIRYAATNGNIDCVKYAHENGCSWDNFFSLMQL